MECSKIQKLFKGCVLVIFYIAISFQANGQGLINGRVMESETSGAAFATVTVLNVTDSLMVKGAITDEEGNYTLRQVPGGRYLIAISSVGFEKVYLDAFDYESSQTLTMPVTRLNEASHALSEVVVSAQRPVMERKSDRYVMDVTASSFQADNLMDIFRALPFVQVQGDGISVNGRSGVLILLDKVPMPNATLKTILETMTGDEIENIEFITNPSSRYPSQVNSVISITTKKSKSFGLTGSIRSNFSQGVKARGLLGTTITYRKEKWVAGLNVNYDGRAGYMTSNGYRALNSDGNRILFNESFIYQSVTYMPSVRGSFEYNINDRHSVGLQANTSYTHISRKSFGENRLSFSRELNGPVDSVLVSDSFEYGYRMLQNYSLFYNGKLDSLGRSVDLILTYTPVRNRETSEMLFQNMIGPEGNILEQLRTVRNINPNQADILIGQMDWELPFSSKWNLTTGAKFTLSKNNTQPTQEVFMDGVFVQEDEFSFIILICLNNYDYVPLVHNLKHYELSSKFKFGRIG